MKGEGDRGGRGGGAVQTMKGGAGGWRLLYDEGLWCSHYDV